MIYLDNNATTKILPEVRNEMIKYLSEYYGNPSSKYYELAEISNNAIKKSRKSVSKLFGCEEDEVIFTSGATESNNFIIKGLSDIQTEKRHIITSEAEHSSILEVLKYLEKKGFTVTYLKVSKKGIINLNDLKNAINEDTFLVTIGWVNSELGSINNIEKIAKVCKNKRVFLHVDATQAVGKINVKIPEGVNFVSMTGHKIYGPKGAGVAILRKDSLGLPIRITPLLHGGEQEFNYRAGTQSVHDIVGLGKACEITLENFENNRLKLQEKELFLVNLLNEKLGENIVYNSIFSDEKVYGVINFQIKGVKNVIFLKKISKYIAASSGSACSISHPSSVLKAIGLSDEQIQQSIRFSISPYDDISELKDIL